MDELRVALAAKVALCKARSAESSKETRDVFSRILATCEEKGVPVKHTVHAAVRTSEQAAAVRGVSLASGAKTMVMNCGAGAAPALLVMSAIRKVDWKAVRRLLPKGAQVMKEDAVPTMTGCLPGAVPPFGSLFRTPAATYVDESLVSQGDTINFNAGLRTESLQLKVTDYLAVEPHALCSFSKP